MIMDDVILQVFEEHEDIFFWPVVSQKDAKTFVKIMHEKGATYSMLSKEIGELEDNLGAWRKGLGRVGIGTRVIQRINKTVESVIESDDEDSNEFNLCQLAKVNKKTEGKVTKGDSKKQAAEKQEQAKREKEKQEREHKEKEQRAKAEKEKKEREENERKEKADREKKEREAREKKDREERDRKEREEKEKERQERVRAEMQKEQERKERERAEKEKQENERKAPAEREEKERKEKERLENERKEKERKEKERQDTETKEQEKEAEHKEKAEPKRASGADQDSDNDDSKDEVDEVKRKMEAIRKRVEMIKRQKAEQQAAAAAAQTAAPKPHPPSDHVDGGNPAPQPQSPPIGSESPASPTNQSGEDRYEAMRKKIEQLRNKIRADDEPSSEQDPDAVPKKPAKRSSVVDPDSQTDSGYSELSSSAIHTTTSAPATNHSTARDKHENQQEDESSDSGDDLVENYDSDLDPDNYDSDLEYDLYKAVTSLRMEIDAQKVNQRSRDGAGHMYILTDTPPSAKNQRVRFGASRCPEKRLEQARAFNYSLRSVVSTPVDTRKACLRDLNNALAKQRLPDSKDWFSAPASVIASAFTEVVERHGAGSVSVSFADSHY